MDQSKKVTNQEEAAKNLKEVWSGIADDTEKQKNIEGEIASSTVADQRKGSDADVDRNLDESENTSLDHTADEIQGSDADTDQ